MFKKLLVVGLATLLSCGIAFADQGGEPNNTHCNGVGNINSPCGGDGQGSGAFGAFDIKAMSFDGAIDFDGKFIPNGFAGGISGAGGLGKSKADGFIVNGLVEGEVSAIGGGLTDTDAYRFGVPDTDLSIGVGSLSTTYAIAGAKAKIKVDPDKGFGEADAHIKGIAAQGSLNVSALGSSPLHVWTSDGHTGGLAAQGSLGAFEGEMFAISGPDFSYRKYIFCGPRINVDSKAGAGMGAEIEMNGFSYSESYRYINFGDGTKTEGMGTNVGAGTEVNSMGYDYDWDKGLGYANANVDGGWVAGGLVGSMTVQENSKATALGVYVGAGSLGTNYEGSAIGGTYTSVTTVKDMKGSVQSAGANMSVVSKVSD